MSEYWISESGYNWLRENFKFIIVGLLLLLFAIGCYYSCIAGASMATEGRVGKPMEDE